MARFAFGAVFARMHILQLMAIGTNRGHVFITLARMTRIASNLFMCAVERKFRFGVIIRFDTPPCLFCVATSAFFAEIALMRVQFLMTVETLTGRFAKFCL
jgi:hypothetical protein